MKGKRNMKVIILIAVLVLAVGIGLMMKKRHYKSDSAKTANKQRV